MSVGGLPRAMGLRDVVLFNIAAIVGLRWITTAGKIGPFALVLWLVALVDPSCNTGRPWRVGASEVWFRDAL